MAQLQIPWQAASLDAWASKYALRDARTRFLEQAPEQTLARVATALAAVEPPQTRAHWRERFEWALAHGAVPAGRILANAGAGAHRAGATTINCTVSGLIPDSMDGIMGRLHEAALTLKAGAGIGYDFSTLRPRGAPVHGSGTTTSGPLPFMDVFDAMCRTVRSAGGRRGAQMGCLDVGHPDVLEFVRAKHEAGRLQQFNLSLLIRDDFVTAVRGDLDWPLAFPAFPEERDDERVWRPFPAIDPRFQRDDQGRVAMKVYRRIRARELWDLIMRSTYEHAEPGFILIDRVNELNNNWFCEDIRATNPCGEQPLPPYGACLLGSVNLTAFVRKPFRAAACFDWDGFCEVVSVFTRMLDNAVSLHRLPLSEQVREIQAKRRHGMGFFGLGSALALMRIPYASEAAEAFTGRAAKELAIAGWRAALELAREKGAAPVLQQDFEITPELLHRRPELSADGLKAGDRVPGRVLHARYSRYMQRIAEVEPELVAQLAEVGARFTHHSSVAPTGTIALSFGNNASSGVEPSFRHEYIRNLVREGRATRDRVDVSSYELLAYRQLVDAKARTGSLPDYFATADSVSPSAHLRIQAAAQRWMDSAISKTINVPADLSFDAFKDLYLDAIDLGLKGCTTFRFNPEAVQGVLVDPQDLDRTVYEFTLADGSTVRAKGSDLIEYEGQVHTAANLHDALRGGYYGRP